jgi:hypothetical protein
METQKNKAVWWFVRLIEPHVSAEEIELFRNKLSELIQEKILSNSDDRKKIDLFSTRTGKSSELLQALKHAGLLGRPEVEDALVGQVVRIQYGEVVVQDGLLAKDIIKI